MIINSKFKLLAASKQDVADGIEFLTDLGFTGLKLKSAIATSNVVYTYEHYSKPEVVKHLGASSEVNHLEFYKFGKSGKVIISSKEKTVTVVDLANNSKQVKPIETHVPDGTDTNPAIEPKKQPSPDNPVSPLAPGQSPNTPGSTENDDSKVPHLSIPPNIVKLYETAQLSKSTSVALSYMHTLWNFFNSSKFGNKLELPKLGLLNKGSGTAFKLRGVWYPSSRKLEISPRLFNAHLSFFVEIFLHEMCHEYVTEIDKPTKKESEVEAGHGPQWQAIMRKVGLNPRRFDPTDNAVYMTDRERKNDTEKTNKLTTINDARHEHKLEKLTNFSHYGLNPVTTIINGKPINGLLIKPLNAAGKKWAFVAEGDEHVGNYVTVDVSQLFKYAGDDVAQFKNSVWAKARTKVLEQLAAAKDSKKIGLGEKAKVQMQDAMQKLIDDKRKVEEAEAHYYDNSYKNLTDSEKSAKRMELYKARIERDDAQKLVNKLNKAISDAKRAEENAN